MTEYKNYTQPYQQAIQWIKDNTLDERGISATSAQKWPSLEATALLIPTLIEAGEINLAQQYAEFLSYIQRPNGAFSGPGGRASAFVSGQVLCAMVSAAMRWERFKPTLEKTADYLLSCQDAQGCFSQGDYARVAKGAYVYLLPALQSAGRILNKPPYEQAAQKAIHFYKNQPALLNPNQLTRFLAYILDGFIDLKEDQRVRPVLEAALASQKNTGAIGAYPDVSWICSTGLAHLALVAYKAGMHQQADAALDELLRCQSPSGGFVGSYGAGAKYFPKEEVALAAKFFLDALVFRHPSVNAAQPSIEPLNDGQWHRAMADHSVEQLADKLYNNDFPVWVQPLLEHTKAGESILELGSGTGELSAILGLYGRRMHLLDYSAESIGFAKKLFAQLNIPAEFYQADICAKSSLAPHPVDWVISSGVLEHFTDEQIVQILKKSHAVCSRGVMSLFPNANAIFYRIGKLKQETEKTWVYGREIPKLTLAPLFKAAGFVNIRECSVGTYHSLRFWGRRFPEVTAFLKSLSLTELRDLNQGYLLFTYGEKA